MLEKLKALLTGKKMYITALCVGAIAAAQALGYVIPDWVYTILGAFGIAATKAAIAKAEPK